MQRITLKEAIGRRLLADMKFGEKRLLLFEPDGVVALFTHSESYAIMDYTDGDDPLGRLWAVGETTLDALVKNGFVTEAERSQALQERARQHEAHQARAQESRRRQYEALRAEFEGEVKS